MTPVRGMVSTYLGILTAWARPERVDLAAATAFLASAGPAIGPSAGVSIGASARHTATLPDVFPTGPPDPLGDNLPIAPEPTSSDMRPLLLSTTLKAPSLACPRCGSHLVQGWGRSRASRRYRCKGCGRTFSSTTNAPWAYSKYPEKWIDMARCMVQSLSVRRAADRLGIHPCTAFRWRHRLLSVLADRRSSPVLSGIVEVTETFYPDCRKGQRNLARSPRRWYPSVFEPDPDVPHYCIVFARDRHGCTLAEIAGLGPPAVDALNRVLGQSITPGSVICSLGRHWYRRFCRQTGLPHHEVRNSEQFEMMCRLSPEPVDPTASINLYNVSGALTYRNGFREWLNRFLGVATKYLTRYLAWFDLLVRIENRSVDTFGRLFENLAYSGHPV